jgi:hypothetical protein
MLALLISPERRPPTSRSLPLCAALSSPISVSLTLGPSYQHRCGQEPAMGQAALLGRPSSGLGFRFWFFFYYFYRFEC